MHTEHRATAVWIFCSTGPFRNLFCFPLSWPLTQPYSEAMWWSGPVRPAVIRQRNGSWAAGISPPHNSVPLLLWPELATLFLASLPWHIWLPPSGKALWFLLHLASSSCSFFNNGLLLLHLELHWCALPAPGTHNPLLAPYWSHSFTHVSSSVVCDRREPVDWAQHLSEAQYLWAEGLSE